MMKSLRAALAMLALMTSFAFAATTTTLVPLTTSSFTDLGAGPIYLSATGGPMVYQIADSQPSATAGGFSAQPGDMPAPLQTTAHIWARAISPLAASAVVSAGGGSSGTDASANIPTLPNVAANFAASGPYASYILVKTVAANSARLSIDIENTSGAQICIVLDDGIAANGAAPLNATVFALAGGGSVGSQGGSWVSLVEKGRVQVYAPSSGAQIAVRQN